jgi:hypothetical protein
MKGDREPIAFLVQSKKPVFLGTVNLSWRLGEAFGHSVEGEKYQFSPQCFSPTFCCMGKDDRGKCLF